jgi:hypothetical protein
MIIGAVVQQPNDRLDYDVDFAKWFVSPTEDFIIGATASVVPTGELAASVIVPPDDNQMVKLWLSEGVDGSDYIVTVQISTNAGRVKEVELEVAVEEF